MVDPAPPAPEEIVEDDSRTYTIGIVLVSMAVGVAVGLLTWALHWRWPGTLWFGYTWPSLRGNGPEAIVQTVAYAAFAVIVIPPVRAEFRRESRKIQAKLAAVHKTVRDQHTEHMAAVDLVHEHLDHLASVQNLPKFERPPKEPT